jgi:DNA polymerase (family 10)
MELLQNYLGEGVHLERSTYVENIQVALLLQEMATLLDLADENPFKTRAYRRAAKSIQNLPQDIRSLHRQDALRQIPGVGAAIASNIDEWLRTGTISQYEELKGRFPAGLLEVSRVPGVGIKTARLLHQELGISSMKDLAEALAQGKLQGVAGLGPKSVERLQRGMARYEQYQGKMLISTAVLLERHLGDFCRCIPRVCRVEATGQLRRRCRVLDRVDLLVVSEDFAGFPGAIAKYPLLKETPRAKDHCLELVVEGLRVHIFLVAPDIFPLRWYLLSGAASHLHKMTEVAAKHGISIGPEGLTDERGSLAVTDEEDIYASVGMQYIPPEMREDQGEVELALEGKLPTLIEPEDLAGDLHVHTNYSDGTSSIVEMAQGAKRAGLSYVALCDHSQSLKIAGGLTPERIREQRKEIEQVNRELNDFTVLAGIEVDILEDGQLDLPDSVLKELDVVVASIHRSFHLDRETMTRRIIAAMENPHVDIIGHLTGRLLGKREGYGVDIERIIEAAVRTGTALEINSHPERLDVDETYARQAVERGVKLAINSDAHSPIQFGFLTYGLWVGRRAWLTQEDVINCWPLGRLMDYLAGEC